MRSGAVDSNKLGYGPGTVQAAFPFSEGLSGGHIVFQLSGFYCYNVGSILGPLAFGNSRTNLAVC